MHIVMQTFDGDINQRVGGQPYLHGDIVGMSPEYHCNTSWIYLIDGDINWLVVSNSRIIFHNIWDIILPIDELLHHFSRWFFNHQPVRKMLWSWEDKGELIEVTLW